MATDDEHVDSIGERIAADEERVQREYARRASDPRLVRYYERVGAAVARAAENRMRAVIDALDALGSRRTLRVLDVGCGSGRDLARLAEAGYSPANLAGIDPLQADVTEARAAVAEADIRVGNGAALPYGDGQFDATLQTTVLSSVVDPAVRTRIAAEMLRVTRPNGLVISYDLRSVTDGNPHLVAIGREELDRLFGEGTDLTIRSMTLTLPLASRLPAAVMPLLAAVPALRSHYLAVVRTPRLPT